jgi:hypothetical protein
MEIVVNYTNCDDGEIECPACGAEFRRETWEMQIGSETECKACEIVLEVTEIDYSRTLYWSTRDDVRWWAFCRIWSAIGARALSERAR